MKKQELRQYLMKLNKGNNAANIIYSLGSLDLKSESDIEKMIEDLSKKLDREPTEKEIVKAFLSVSIKEKEEQAKTIEQRQEMMQKQMEQQEMQKQQIRLQQEQAKKQAAKQKVDRLMEGLKDKAGKDRQKDLEISNKFFADISDDLLPEVLEFLQNELGFEFTVNEHGIQEQEGRDISVDTVTKEQLENGEVKMSISKEKLQSEKFRELLDEKELEFEDRKPEIEPEREEDKDVKIEDELDDR